MSLNINLFNLPDDILYIIIKDINDYLSAIRFIRFTCAQLRKMPLQLEEVGYNQRFQIDAIHKEAIITSIPRSLRTYIKFNVITLIGNWCPSYFQNDDIIENQLGILYQSTITLYTYINNNIYTFYGLHYYSNNNFGCSSANLITYKLFSIIDKYIWNINTGTIKVLIITKIKDNINYGVNNKNNSFYLKTNI